MSRGRASEALKDRVTEATADGLTLANAVYELLRRDIILAELEPGTKLRLDFMCRRYGVGSSPMREALTLLAGEGFVTRRENRGFYVADVAAEDFAELTDTRCRVEEIALRQSIAKGGAEWEEALVLSFHRLSRLPRPVRSRGTRPEGEWVRFHDAFHEALVAACGSRWLERFCRHLRDQAFRYASVAASARMATPPKEHEAIMKAALARDADAAAALLAAHYRSEAEAALQALGGRGDAGRSGRRTHGLIAKK